MRKYFFCFFTAIFTLTLSAHPHMWFTSEFEFVFSDNTVEGVKVIWTFDKFFSADIISGYDRNHDGIFSESEITDVFNNAFTYTQNYYYFTFIRVGKNRFSPKYIARENFSAHQKNNVLSYEFYIRLNGLSIDSISISCYDYTFFCDIQYPENCVRFLGTAQKPKYKIRENKNTPIYYNPFGSIDDMRIYNEWAPGLNTYYPKEIMFCRDAHANYEVMPNKPERVHNE